MSKELKKVPYVFKNDATDNKVELTLSGTIRKKYWRDEEVIDEASVKEVLDGVTAPIHIYLNSPGGDVFEGIAICNYLKNHPQDVTVEVTGLAASAASILAMGADNVVMNIGTSFMIHEASTYAYGNKSDVQKTLNALETIDESLVNIYVDRTGNTSEEVTDWLSGETWFTAEEAVEHGFADEVKKKAQPVKDQVDITALVNKSVAEAVNAMHVSNQEQKNKPVGLKKLFKGE